MYQYIVDCVLNVMAHAQKPDFVFRRNGRVHLNRRGRRFSRLLTAKLCASAVVMLDKPCSEVVWRVLATHSIRQFPLYFPSRVSPCAITFQLDSTNLEFSMLEVLNFYFPNVILPVSPLSLSLIRFRTRIIGNNTPLLAEDEDITYSIVADKTSLVTDLWMCCDFHSKWCKQCFPSRCHQFRYHQIGVPYRMVWNSTSYCFICWSLYWLVSGQFLLTATFIHT